MHKKYSFPYSRAVFATLLLAGLSFASVADAATLGLTPSTTKVSVGDTFRVDVRVNTQGASINNAEGIVHFPTGTVSILSIDTKSSVFSLWPEAAAFSSASGTVSFNGGVVNPGYTGGSGQVISVFAKALKPGTATLSISGASVRANDGFGTDVLTSAGGATVAISAAAPTPEPDVPAAQPAAVVQTIIDAMQSPLVLFSETNPDQAKWYDSNSIAVSWQKPEGSLGTQIVFGGPPGTVPTGALVSLTRKEYGSVRDGVSYFHARYKTASGWSRVATYAFHIDTTAPESLSVSTKTESNGSMTMSLRGIDETSGVDHFLVSVADAQPVRVQAVNGAAAPAVPPIMYLGTYEATVVAVDKAGNRKTVTVPLVVTTLPAPVILEFPAAVKVGKTIGISGNSLSTSVVDLGTSSVNGAAGKPLAVAGSSQYSDSRIFVFIKLPDGKVEQYLVDTDAQGNFNLITEKTRSEGYYEIWAQYINERGERSYESAHVRTLSVATPWLRLTRLVTQHSLILFIVVFAFIGILSVIVFIHLP